MAVKSERDAGSISKCYLIKVVTYKRGSLFSLSLLFVVYY
jgi:hypothetical protein